MCLKDRLDYKWQTTYVGVTQVIHTEITQIHLLISTSRVYVTLKVGGGGGGGNLAQFPSSPQKKQGRPGTYCVCVWAHALNTSDLTL